ncbi:hypothetical protein HBH82_089850 [Parastagonospora nodorum]|nr:hypothetical protein HBH82_089850 [Parastagonospora nodorum]KAH4710650.1 hypothetical protein HBH67_033420 [Parastagonospora nodorum]KAH4715214.1 hypothetical protein HBH78_034800 [Parastagonospora nodorum]KAH4784500.1 hypothetical protein HBH62_091790 [Parastagonospora nodorum]KAH4838430.1 hypothetical protein HBH63_009890 [Parastagonospora nodorum]
MLFSTIQLPKTKYILPALNMLTDKTSRTGRALLRTRLISLSWTSAILTLVYVAAQLILLVFVAVRSAVAKTSSRTVHEVSADWLSLLIPEFGKQCNDITAIYAVIVIATLLLIRPDRLWPKSFWVLQIVTLCALSLCMQLDQETWADGSNQGLLVAGLFVARTFLTALVVNTPGWDVSCMGTYEDWFVHPVRSARASLQYVADSIRTQITGTAVDSNLQTLRRYFNQPYDRTMRIRTVLTRRSYIQVAEQFIRMMYLYRHLDSSSTAAYELVRLVAIAIGLQASHYTFLRYATRKAFKYDAKEGRIMAWYDPPQIKRHQGIIKLLSGEETSLGHNADDMVPEMNEAAEYMSEKGYVEEKIGYDAV